MAAHSPGTGATWVRSPVRALKFFCGCSGMADDVALHTLPIPRLDRPRNVRVPRPSPLPVVTEDDLEKAEKRLELTELRDLKTMRPGQRGKQDRQNAKRLIRKLETSIESGQLNERDMYDAIVNLHLLKRTLAEQESRHAAAAFEHALLAQRVVTRFVASLGS